MMNYTVIKTAIENSVFIITINRPDKLNALNKQVFSELDQAMDEAINNKEIKGVIITGEGPKAFVAGADIREFLEIANEDAMKLAITGQKVFSKIENCPKAVIAAVNGFALGGGCELAMACHFRIASTNAKFGQPEVNLGLIPGYGGTQRLPMLVGKGLAMEMILTGNMITAEEAHRCGLVNHIIPPEELMEKAIGLMNTIISKSPVAVSKAIAAINNFYPEVDYNSEAKLFGEAFSSEDKKEGTAAFLEKRKPVFK